MTTALSLRKSRECGRSCMHDAQCKPMQTIDVKIPADYTVDDIPDPVKVDAGFASYQNDVKADGNVLHYSREYILRKLELTADQYSDLRKFESEIYTDENRSAVLKKVN